MMKVSEEDVGVPRDVDRHLLVGGRRQNPEQLVEHGGQEVDHHVALHGVETLRGRSQADHIRANRTVIKITRFINEAVLILRTQRALT